MLAFHTRAQRELRDIANEILPKILDSFLFREERKYPAQGQKEPSLYI